MATAGKRGGAQDGVLNEGWMQRGFHGRYHATRSTLVLACGKANQQGQGQMPHHRLKQHQAGCSWLAAQAGSPLSATVAMVVLASASATLGTALFMSPPCAGQCMAGSSRRRRPQRQPGITGGQGGLPRGRKQGISTGMTL